MFEMTRAFFEALWEQVKKWFKRQWICIRAGMGW